MARKRKLIPIGARFGKLVVVERAENIGRGTAYKCQCDCGNEDVQLATNLRTRRKRSCGCGRSRRKLIPISTRFGKLVVIERVSDDSEDKHTVYNCQCDCGNELVVRAANLRGGYRQRCLECTMLPKGEAGFNSLFSSYRTKANRRGRVFELTKDAFRKLVTSNCAYCGAPPGTLWRTRTERGNFTYNGIDRMNNDLGYTPDNVTTCCWPCNVTKGKKPYDEWIAWLDRIAKFRTRRIMTISVIKPSDIDTSQHFWDAFGNYETEVSARWIVRFCQDRNSWEPFTYDELNSFCEANGDKTGFWFNRLGKDGLIQKKDGLWHVTHRFICRCYEASPKGEMSNGN